MLYTAIWIIWVFCGSLMLKYIIEDKVYLDRRMCSHFEHWCGMLVLIVFSPLIFIADLICYIRRQRHDS